MTVNCEIKQSLSRLVSVIQKIPVSESTRVLKPYFDYLESLTIFEGWNHPGTHVHHIIPKCLYKFIENCNFHWLNSWESGNLIRVTRKTHTELHLLLYRCTGLSNLRIPLTYQGVSLSASIASHTEIAKLKRKMTMLKRYGNTEGPCHSSEARAKASPKAVQTIIKRFGSFQNCLRSREINERIAKEHDGDAYWQIHTKEVYEKLSKSLGTSIYRTDTTGNILAEYRSIDKAIRDLGYSSRLKIAIRKNLLYKGSYWVKVNNYQEWFKSKFSSTTISDESTPKQVEVPSSDENQMKI